MIAAALLGLTGVVLGAFGAHGLDGKISQDGIDSFSTGVRYQFWHALALMILFIAGDQLKWVKGISILWFIGTLVFSGSIYLLSTNEITPIDFAFLGPITPLGGLLMIGGWVILLLSAFRSK